MLWCCNVEKGRRQNGSRKHTPGQWYHASCICCLSTLTYFEVPPRRLFLRVQVDSVWGLAVCFTSRKKCWALGCERNRESGQISHLLSTCWPKAGWHYNRIVFFPLEHNLDLLLMVIMSVVFAQKQLHPKLPKKAEL